MTSPTPVTVHKVVQLQPETALTDEQKATLLRAIECAADDYFRYHMQHPTHLTSQDSYRIPWPDGSERPIVDPAYFAEPVAHIVVELHAKQHRSECAVYVSLESASGVRTNEVCVYMWAAENAAQVNYWPRQLSTSTLDVIVDVLSSCVPDNLE